MQCGVPLSIFRTPISQSPNKFREEAKVIGQDRWFNGEDVIGTLKFHEIPICSNQVIQELGRWLSQHTLRVNNSDVEVSKGILGGSLDGSQLVKKLGWYVPSWLLPLGGLQLWLATGCWVEGFWEQAWVWLLQSPLVTSPFPLNNVEHH